MGILLLSWREIEELLDMEEVMAKVEEAFLEKARGRVQMPPKPYLYFTKHEGDLRVMPAYLEAKEVASVKIVNSHPKNPSKGLPTVMGLIVLVEPSTGAPLSIMDGTWITAMRTGAAGGIATKHLAKKGSRILGLIGAGRQAYTQLMALSLVMRLERIKVYDVKVEAARGLVRWAEERGLPAEVVGSGEEATKGSDVVVTLTPSRSPVIMEEWVEDGLHINAFGADAPGKQELDPRILKRSRIFVDDREQAIHGGEVNVPIRLGLLRKEDIVGELGEVIAGELEGRRRDDEITIFASTGLAIQDAVTAELVYRRAISTGRGREVEILQP